MPPAAVGDHLRHQRRVLGRDRLVGEVDHLRHAEDALVVLDPLLHVPELDVAHDVVDRHEQQLVGIAWGVAGLVVAGQERAAVVLALDEQVLGVAVGGDRGELHAPVLVLGPVRGHDPARAVRDGVLVGGRGVRNAQRDLVHAVAVAGVVIGDLVAAVVGAGEHEPDAALLEHVRAPVAPAGLEAGVGGLGEAERVREVVGGLRRVPDVELDMVDPVDRHAVVLGYGVGDCARRKLLGGHEAPLSTVFST